MTHIITRFCVRDGGCVNICPVDCIIPGLPQEKYPLYYIDPQTCIDCGACIRECPYNAIFPIDEVPSQYRAKGGEVISAPEGSPGFESQHEIRDFNNKPIHLLATRTLSAGELIDLRPDISVNADYFDNGPGYSAVEK